ITAEATRWPAPSADYLKSPWWREGSNFSLHRKGEAANRPKAVRALLLYPMNALVEDQMVRLRKMLDSPEALQVLDQRAKGNRIFFGRYTSASPVPGYLVHPRRSDQQEKTRAKSRLDRTKAAMRTIAEDQKKASDYDRQNPHLDPTRYLFPSPEGSELITRWDMQETPPDLLITNISMLNAMLSREVDAKIFNQTREWLETDPNSYFFLVLDELHLCYAAHHAVLVGHSMGGVISRLLVSDADVSDLAMQKMNEAQLKRLKENQVIRERFQFKDLPYFKRVVFVSAPHHGTDYADRWFTQIARRIIRLPADFFIAVEMRDEKNTKLRKGLIENGASNLSRSSNFMKLTQAIQPSSNVVYHSIMGNINGTTDKSKMSDGIVPYQSSHLGGEQSELIIKGGHSIQTSPEAILELRRILRLHLKQSPPSK
ncbi:hypothetical protein OHW26_17210, partial [Acinetobacter baumannii]|nr:hypothetical protein [Acinetobacter baumannii]